MYVGCVVHVELPVRETTLLLEYFVIFGFLLSVILILLNVVCRVSVCVVVFFFDTTPADWTGDLCLVHCELWTVWWSGL